MVDPPTGQQRQLSPIQGPSMIYLYKKSENPAPPRRDQTNHLCPAYAMGKTQVGKL